MHLKIFYLFFRDNLLELIIFFDEMNYESIEQRFSYGVSNFSHGLKRLTIQGYNDDIHLAILDIHSCL